MGDVDTVMENVGPGASLPGLEPHLHPSVAVLHWYVLDLSEHQLHDLRKKNRKPMTTPTSKGLL